MMKKLQSVESKIFLKSFWWFILLASVGQILFVDGYIGLKKGFDWNFIYQPKSYWKLLFYIVSWTLVFYFLFWRSNKKNLEKEKPQFPEAS